MSKVLSKYSKTKNLTTEYQSQIDYVDATMKQQKAIAGDDMDTPLTFKEWYGRNVGIIPGEDYIQYNNYLKNWYSNRYVTIDNTINTKESYVNLLKQLKIILKSDEDYKWIQDINLDDNLELEDSIPYFARKLKEIAIYLINKREAIKKAKLKYNMSGSKQAIEKLFYEYLLKAFTKRDYVLNVPEQSAWNMFPELSAINNNFQIQIQELYDDTSYFDKDTSLPASAYFDLTQQTSSYYVDTMNFDASALDWVFQTGFMNICADNSLIWIMSATLNDSDWDRIKLSEKYLGEKQYFLNEGYYILDTKQFDYELQQGNNWFYWPSGEYHREDITNYKYQPIMLSSTNLIIDGATAGFTHKEADKIFVKVGSELKAAWLKEMINKTITKTMSAVIGENDVLKFRFPYPGFGISGEGLEWTGKQLDNLTNSFNYLDTSEQESILEAYWTSITPVSTFNPISIHDTQLIDNDANADQIYENADKIIIRLNNNVDKIHDIKPNNLYQEQFDYAWLYKLLKTDLPVTVGQNYISWPIERYETTPIVQVPTSQCIPISLSSINVENTMIGSRGGYGLFDSDIIYKLDSPNGYPIECAFLSGCDLSTVVPGASGKIQPSFTLICKPGNVETFIWVDNSIDINKVITHKEHQKDCNYIESEHISIYGTRGKPIADINKGIGNYQDCNCKAILYSPIGHPGSKYDDYDKMADVILVDKDWNTNQSTGWPNLFNLSTWIGRDGLPYNSSNDFAFYQLSGNNIEVDVGWGKGRWVTSAGNTLTLEKGVQYKYLRANLRRDPADLIQYAVPNLYIKQQHVNVPKSIWTKCTIQDDGTWLKTSSASDMVLKPGDYILYDHTDSYWYCLSTNGTLGTAATLATTATYIGDYNGWVNLNFVPTGYDINLTWPNKYYPTNPPLMLASEVTYVSWDIKLNGNNLHYIDRVDSAEIVTFNTSSTGIYTISATGYGQYRNEAYNLITPVTCVNPNLVHYISGAAGIETVYNDRLNFIINVPLSGWNYTTNSYDSSSQGGRPFWAKGTDDDSQVTKYKGIDIWGGSIRTIIDNYTLLTQPDPATLYLSADCYTEYYHKGSDNLIWKESIPFNVNETSKQWNKLVIDNNVISPLSSYLLNINTELIASATDVPTDIILYQSNDKMWVNYWAQNAFTWSQILTSDTLGIPPTGGIWITPVTGEMINPIVPYANLTNRHYPTIASIPYIDNLYSTEDEGGYFTPKHLGASIYLGKNYINEIDISIIGNNPDSRGLSGVFQDIEIYTSDNGLSERIQHSPIVTTKIDPTWMKANQSEFNKSGMIVNANTYQEFIPYQTKYETTKQNVNGLRRQNDEYDPWYDSQDSIWQDKQVYPENFRGDYPITKWYDTNSIPQSSFIYQWKTDIFGNQYALLKDKSINTMYKKNLAMGEIWVRNDKNQVRPATELLSGIYDSFYFYSPQVSSEISNNNIKNFDIWYDTLMVETTSHVLIEKINYNYDTGEIYSITDNLRVIDLSANIGGKFAGIWLFDESKRITFCNIVSTVGNVLYPEIYMLNLDNSDLTKQYTGVGLTNQISALALSSIEDPVFTYNNTTKMYNIAFLGYSPIYSGMILTKMNIKNLGSQNELISINSIVPIAG